MGYVKRIKSVFERVGMDSDPKTAVPPRWMFWEEDELDDWFDSRREANKAKK